MSVPDSLSHRIELFSRNGVIFREFGELFSEVSWTAVLVGQGVVPDDYHPVVDTLDEARLKSLIARVKSDIARAVRDGISHEQALDPA